MIIWSPFSTSLWAHHDDLDPNSQSMCLEGEELVLPNVEVLESTIFDSLDDIEIPIDLFGRGGSDIAHIWSTGEYYLPLTSKSN